MKNPDNLPKKKRRFQIDGKRITRRVRRAGNITQRHTRRFVLRRLDNVRLVTSEITTWLVIVGVLIATLGLQQAWSAMTYTTSSGQTGGVYVEGVIGSIDTLNPLLATNEAEASAAKLMFSSLYSYDITGKLHTDLATSMKISDSKVYTVTIRDVQWQDGQALTADDIVYTIGLIKNPQVRSPLRINWTDVAVKKIDQSTVEFKLPATYAAFPHALTFPIVPKHVLQGIDPSTLRESSFSQNPVGSGVFKFRRLQTADLANASKVVQLTPNERYYGAAAKLSRFELRAYSDETALEKAVKNGEVTGAAGVDLTLATAERPSQYDIISEPFDKGVYLIINTKHSILQEKTVRQALQLATDSTAIRQAIGGGVQELDGPILQSSLPSDAPRAPAVDVKKAAKLLDDAGWHLKNNVRTKGEQQLKIVITTTNNSEFNKVLDLVKKQWATLGVIVEANTVDSNSAASNFVQGVLQPRNFDILLYELALGADPDVYAYWHSSQASSNGYNFSNYSDQLADAALSSARSRLEPDLRNAKYVQFVSQWLSDVPAIGLYQSTSEYLVNKNATIVSPQGPLPSLSDRYARVSEWTVSSATVYKTP